MKEQPTLEPKQNVSTDAKRPYTRPTLRNLGEVATLTAGSTGKNGDGKLTNHH